MIDATITFLPDAATVAGMRQFAQDLRLFSIPESTAMLDGGHAHPAAGPGRVLRPHALAIPTVADLFAWVDSLRDLADDVAIVAGDTIAVAAPRVVAERSVCGEHTGESPMNLYVTINPDCLDSQACLG